MSLKHETPEGEASVAALAKRRKVEAAPGPAAAHDDVVEE
jgi:hypothetical protein